MLENNEWESYYEVDKNTQIKTFSLTSDSVSALAKVAFTIDQINGRIMNLDSMEYGTKIGRVICNMTYGSYAKEIKVMAEAKGDTVSYNAADSIDFPNLSSLSCMQATAKASVPTLPISTSTK